VDVPLANLFVHAARAPEANAEGEDRARSASEAFLFRRLQTLPETSGRFRQNAELPISFDGHGKMRWTCYARKPAWSLSWMGRSISVIWMRIDGIEGRTPCCSKMDILCCDS